MDGWIHAKKLFLCLDLYKSWLNINKDPNLFKKTEPLLPPDFPSEISYFDFLDNDLIQNIADFLFRQHRYHDLALLARTDKRIKHACRELLNQAHQQWLEEAGPFFEQLDDYLLQLMFQMMYNAGNFRDLKKLMDTSSRLHYIGQPFLKKAHQLH